MMANDSLLEGECSKLGINHRFVSTGHFDCVGLRIVAAEVASKYSNLLFPATLRFSTQDATGRIRCLITGCFFDSTLIINEKPHQSLKRNRDAIEDLNSATLEIEVWIIHVLIILAHTVVLFQIPASTLDDSILINNVLGYLRLLRLVATVLGFFFLARLTLHCHWLAWHLQISYAVRCELHGCRWRRTFDVISSRSRVLFFRRVDRGGDGRQVAISLHCYSRYGSLCTQSRRLHSLVVSVVSHSGYRRWLHQRGQFAWSLIQKLSVSPLLAITTYGFYSTWLWERRHAEAHSVKPLQCTRDCVYPPCYPRYTISESK